MTHHLCHAWRICAVPDACVPWVLVLVIRDSCMQMHNMTHWHIWQYTCTCTCTWFTGATWLMHTCVTRHTGAYTQTHTHNTHNIYICNIDTYTHKHTRNTQICKTATYTRKHTHNTSLCKAKNKDVSTHATHTSPRQSCAHTNTYTTHTAAEIVTYTYTYIHTTHTATKQLYTYTNRHTNTYVNTLTNTIL